MINPASLPLKRELRPVYRVSLAIAVLMVGASLVGLISPGSIYTSNELRIAFFANDVVNLLIGLPILLVSMWLARRESLAGMLLWPGALLYVVYNYIAYVIGIPSGWAVTVYLALVGLSAYGLYSLLGSIDLLSVQHRLSGAVPIRTSAWVVIIFGTFFALRAIGIVFQASREGTVLPATEIGVLAADMVLSAAFIVGGVLLLRHRPLGYASGLGLLFAASSLFIGLIVVLLLQPLLTDAPFAPLDIIVVALMGLICFIPFGLFVRAVLSQGASS